MIWRRHLEGRSHIIEILSFVQYFLSCLILTVLI